MKNWRIVLALVFVCILLAQTSCSVPAAVAPTATTYIYVEGSPREGQPAFPSLGRYWVVDKGCNFAQDKVKIADETFEKLRTDGIAEVAVICQSGILDKGSSNDDKIWLRDWARWAKMGAVDINRSVVWLIRPDAKAQDQMVTLEVSRWLTWYTAIEYSDALQEAANYSNWKDFNGALISITRNVDGKLRELWKTHSNEGGAVQ
jgi:hypothetical protein